MDEGLHKVHNLEPVRWGDDPEQEFLVAAKEGVFKLGRSRENGPLIREQIGSGENGGCGEVRPGSAGGGKRFVAAVLKLVRAMTFPKQKAPSWVTLPMVFEREA